MTGERTHGFPGVEINPVVLVTFLTNNLITSEMTKGLLPALGEPRHSQTAPKKMLVVILALPARLTALLVGAAHRWHSAAAAPRCGKKWGMPHRETMRRIQRLVILRRRIEAMHADRRLLRPAIQALCY